MHRVQNTLKESHLKLNKTIPLRIQTSITKIGHYQKLIDMASPKNVLKRGFSITRTQDGKVLRSVHGVKRGDTIRSEFLDGEVESNIIG